VQTNHVTSEQRLCSVEPAPACYAVDVLAEGFVSPRNLVSLPDGRLLLLEGETRIVIVDNNGRKDALTLPDRLTNQLRIQAIAIGPDFDSSRTVYVALIRSRERTQRRTISVARMREESGTLIESGIVLRELPMVGGDAALAVGPDQAIYLAMSSDRDTGRAVIARFDGTRDAQRGRADRSVIAADVALPARLLVERNQLWIGRVGAQSPTLRMMRVGTTGRRSVPLVVRFEGWPESSQFRDLAVASSGTAGASRTVFLALDGPAALFRAALDGADTTTATLSRVPLNMNPVGIAAGTAGEAYVLAQAIDAPTSRIRLLRLRPI
jgi:hypothetical protein